MQLRQRLKPTHTDHTDNTVHQYRVVRKTTEGGHVSMHAEHGVSINNAEPTRWEKLCEASYGAKALISVNESGYNTYFTLFRVSQLKMFAKLPKSSVSKNYLFHRIHVTIPIKCFSHIPIICQLAHNTPIIIPIFCYGATWSKGHIQNKISASDFIFCISKYDRFILAVTCHPGEKR